MSGRTLWWLLIAFLTIGCRSGGDPAPVHPPVDPPVDPPIVTSVVIESVAPQGLVGTPGDAMTFTATMRGGSGPVTYAWDFGAGATPLTSTEAAPQIALGPAGTYSGLLRLTDGKSQDVLAFEYRVTDTPVVQSVTTSDAAPMPLGTLDFTVTALGEPTVFAWDFGGGAIPQFSTEASPRVTAQEADTYVASVRVGNAAGMAEEVSFTYDVAVPTAPTFRLLKLPSESPGAFSVLSLAASETGIGLVYQEQGQTVHYCGSTGSLSNDASGFPAHVVIDEAVALPGPQCLGFDGAGRPYVIFSEPIPGTDPARRDLKLARGKSAGVSSASDWDVQVARGELIADEIPAALYVEATRLLVMYKSAKEFKTLSAIELDSDSPMELVLTDGRYYTPDSDYVEAHWTLALVGGIVMAPQIRDNGRQPAKVELAWPIDLMAFPSEEPSSDYHWTEVELFGFGSLGGTALVHRPTLPQLSDWNGMAAVACSLGAPGGDTFRAQLHFAEGMPPNSYEFSVVTVSPEGHDTRTMGNLVAKSRLAVLYADDETDQLMLARQFRVDPVLPGSWESTAIVDFDLDTFPAAAITVFHDRIVVAFVDPADGILTLAFAEGNY